jgi:cytochrome c-type biogenesis protein
MLTDTTTATNLFANASLLVAFLGGAVMLFAPCCITLMLPAYLGTAFKSKSKVILMTMVFAAGVASVMLPIVLGVRYAASFASAHHYYVYAFGSALMIGIGIMSLFGKTISLPFVSRLKSPRVTDVTSAYLLGVVSGLSSSCCAPVLLGALTLSALSPSLLQAAGVGLAYTLGIVFPLFIIGLFFQQSLMNKTLSIQRIKFNFGNLKVSLANFLAFVVFTGTGIVMLFLTMTNRLNMNFGTADLSIKLKAWIDRLAKPIQAIPYSQVIFAVLLVAVLIYLIRRAYRQAKLPDEDDQQ